MTTQTKESQDKLTPAAILDLLKAGNQRFQDNVQTNRDLLAQAEVTADGQFPYAVVLSCIDSRTSAELIFDQGMGDIFSARVAGNVLNGDILGSMEFACKLAGSKLIVIMGHTSCGAVKGACAGAELGNLTGLLGKIKPAVDAAVAAGVTEGPEHIQKVADTNVANMVAELREKSPVLSEMIDAGDVGIVAAMHNVRTGAVDFQELQTGKA